MRPHAKKKSKKPAKMAQMFWALDADTQQPVCFTTATASRTVAQATPQRLDIASSILDPQPGQALVMADDVHRRSSFDLLVPMPGRPAISKRIKAIPAEQFTRRWAGYAAAKLPYNFVTL